jgi:Cellulose binding domain
VAIGNTGASAFNGWTLTFTSYNATIAPGGRQSFGFQGTWTSDDAAPTAFTVNGVTCM